MSNISQLSSLLDKALNDIIASPLVQGFATDDKSEDFFATLHYSDLTKVELMKEDSHLQIGMASLERIQENVTESLEIHKKELLRIKGQLQRSNLTESLKKKFLQDMYSSGLELIAGQYIHAGVSTATATAIAELKLKSLNEA